VGSIPGPTALVLVGGGSLGAVQVGMLAELATADVRPDFIVGVSAGAINAAFFAHAPNAATAERLTSLWSRVTTREALGLSWRSLLGLVGLRDHIANPSGLRGLLERHLPYRDFSETAVPLHIVCADLVTGDEVVLSRGAVIEAVLASTAIPGVFPPVDLDGRRLIDGVFAGGTPIAAARRLGAARVIVLPCGFACADKTVSRRALGRAIHAMTLLSARQLRQDFERYQDLMAICVVPPLCPLSQPSYDYSHGAALIARARDSTHAWLQSGGLERQVFPHGLAIHTH
jgi:NTE family protein